MLLLYIKIVSDPTFSQEVIYFYERLQKFPSFNKIDFFARGNGENLCWMSTKDYLLWLAGIQVIDIGGEGSSWSC